MPDGDIRDDVTQVKVAGLLQQRQPAILEDDPDQVAKFKARVAGAAVEVVILLGPTPPAGPLRDLGVECIALQTGSEIEYAEFPEQQAPGDDGRGYHLHQLYLEQVAKLEKYVLGSGAPSDPSGAGSTGALSPQGSFPRPLPDLAERGVLWIW